MTDRRAAYLLAALASAPAAAQPAPILDNVLPEDRAMTRRAYAAFTEQCPGLGKLTPWIKSITLSDEAFVLNQDAEARGWTIAVGVEYKLRNEVIYSGTGLSNDYLYMLGAGKEPGIASMGAGASFCQGKDGSDFVPVPAMKFLTSWPSLANEQPPKRRLSHR